MFSTFKQRLMLGVYVFILLSIPVGAYLASQRQTVKSSASEQKNAKPVVQVPPKPSTSPAKQLLSTSQTAVSDQKTSPSPSPSGESPTIATSFGPTLTFKVSLEGRPPGNQATKMFVGIAEGSLSSNPKFLLSFTVDLPASGEYSNLSLAGLNSGSQYTALLKSSAQIATSSAFTMSPTTTNLNNGEPINLISGDLNEDNVVNSADYSVAQKALGTTPNSSNWNENADFNKDGVINAFDLGFIIKHMGQTGDSGTWTSPIPPPTASSSAVLTSPAVGGPIDSPGPPSREAGHWIWIPKY